MAYKLIVADGSPLVQKVVQMAFGPPDFEVHAYEDGLEALQALAQVNPDAVILGVSLPRRDGYDVGRFLRSREDFKKTALILLRNGLEPLDQEKMRGLECDEIVSKPFDSEKLAGTVREIIDRKKGPLTYPEESLLDEASGSGSRPLFDDTDFAPPENLPAAEDGLEDRVRGILRGEILSMERELEKRLKASLRAELVETLEASGKKTP
jgi:DNA-binding response OmpR family regulator